MLVACGQIVDAGFDVALDRPKAPVETRLDAADGSHDSTAIGGKAGAPDSSSGTPNTAPEARDGTLVVVEGARMRLQPPSFDADGDPRQHRIVGRAELGEVAIDGTTGDFVYESREDEFGNDSFTYQVNDGKLEANAVGTIRVTVVARGPLRADAGVVPLPAHRQWIGRGLDIEGDTAVVGARENDLSLAYVMRRDAFGFWKLSQRIAAGIIPSPAYGTDLALSGDWMVVAGWGSDGAPGAAYFYKRPSHDADFKVMQRIDTARVDGLLVNNSFQWQIALEGDVAVVGADRELAGTSTDGGFDQLPGAALVFRRHFDDQWRLEQRIPAPNARTEEYFGWNLDIANGALVTTAAVRDSTAGALYVFSHTAGTWKLERRFDADPPSAFGTFGSHVAAHADKILVSCCSRLPNGAYAYVREGSDWLARGPFEQPVGDESRDLFQITLALHESVAIINRLPYYDLDALGTGYVYHYADTTAVSGWRYSGRKLLGTTEGRNGFGQSVAFDGVTAVITAPSESDYQGAVYFFGIEPPPIGQ
jgi:hypothetical protein